MEMSAVERKSNNGNNTAETLLPEDCQEASGLDEVSSSFSNSSSSWLKPGSPLASVLTLSCVSLGVGVFNLPAQFASVGPTVGTVLIIVSALLANIALLLMCQLTDRLHVESLEELCFMAMGRVGKAMASIFFIITCLVCNSAHLLVVSDLGCRLLHYWIKGFDDPSTTIPTADGWQYKSWSRALVIGCLGLVVMPFCWTRFINNLRFMSTMSVCWIILICMVCTVYSIITIAEDGWHNLDTSLPIKEDPVKALKLVIEAGAAIAFAFSSIMSFFPVHKEANNKTVMYVNVNISTILCMSFYTMVALFGALAHTKPADMYLEQFPFSNVIFQIGFVGLCIVIVLLYPVVNFPLARSLDNLIFDTDEPSTLRLRIYSVVILAVIMALDSVMPCTGSVFGIGGGLGLGMLSYGLPGLCYILLCTKPFIRNGEEVQRRRSIPLNITAALITFYGLFLTIGTVYTTLEQLINRPGQC